MPKTAEIVTYSPAHKAMQDSWPLIDALNGGTRRMRDEASTWLPREKAEPEANWKMRVARSILYNAYVKTKRDLLGKPYARSILLAEEDKQDELLQEISKDADGRGTPLTDLCKYEMEMAIDYGFSLILVDMPTRSASNANAKLPEIKKKGLRPFFTVLSAQQVIDYTEDKAENGSPRMRSIKWLSCESRTVGMGQVEVEIVTRMTFVYDDDFELDIPVVPVSPMAPVNVEGAYTAGEEQQDFEPVSSRNGTVTKWVKRAVGSVSGEEWTLESETEHTFVGCPLELLYTNRKSHMCALPVLEELAWLNLAHYQGDSDHRSALRFARIGILLLTGFSQRGEGDPPLVAGPGSVLIDGNPNATAQYIEQSGSAISLGVEDLLTLEARMEVMGLKPLFEKRAASGSATQSVMDAAEQTSDLATWTNAQQKQVKKCYEHAAKWLGVKLTDKFEVDIFSDFSIPYNDTAGVNSLMALRKDRQIDHGTLIEGLKRRNVLPETASSEEILEALKEEGDNGAVQDFENALLAIKEGRLAVGGAPEGEGDSGLTSTSGEDAEDGAEAAGAPGARRGARAGAANGKPEAVGGTQRGVARAAQAASGQGRG